MRVFYNEIDPQKAEWLRQLMVAGIVEKGIVDERSIEEIKPGELDGYGQCHFFAGIGIWSYALRLAGYHGPCWTGSCPCQPFSVAGQGKGEADARHLWPAWFRLIAERRPVLCFGEQVSDGDGQAWLDAVQLQMESIGYRFGSLALPAASVGAPHGRHRTFFVADTKCNRGLNGRGTGEEHSQRSKEAKRGELQPEVKRLRALGKLAEPVESERGRRTPDGSRHQRDGRKTGREQNASNAGRDSIAGQLEHSKQAGLEGHPWYGHNSHEPGRIREGSERSTATASPTNGFWADAEWVPCRVPEVPGAVKWRAIEPGTFPLAHGAAARILRLRGYGDGIVAQVAAQFIKAYLEIVT